MSPAEAVSRTNPGRSLRDRAEGLIWASGAIAQTIVFALGLTYLIAAGALYFLGAISWPIYPAAVALAAAGTLLLPPPGGGTGRTWEIGGAGCAVLLLLVAPPLVACWFDGSHDGLAYHQSAILQLASGWNPLRGEAPPVVHMVLELAHYPRASWMLGVALMKCFGTIEAAKAVNLLSMVAAGAMAISLLVQHRPAATSPVPAAVAGAGLAANPVAFAQLFSSYVDGFLGSLLLLVVLASVRVARGDGYRAVLVLVFAIVLCVNLKFTAVVYLGVGLLVLLGMWVLLRRNLAVRRVILWWVAALVPAICIVGADPYVSNTVHYGHPFYPLLGEGSHDWGMASNRPRDLAEMGHAERFARSLFSTPKNLLTGPIVLQPPWSVTRADIFQLANYDLRIGGFGPLFGAGLVLSLPLLFFMPGSGRSWAAAVWGSLVFVVATVAINPESWWARYVPQAWWFPWIVVAGIVLAGLRGVPRAAAFALAVVLAVDVGIVGAAATGHAYFHTEKQRERIAGLVQRQAQGERSYIIHFGVLEGIAHRYEKAGIRFVRIDEVTRLPCADPENLGGPGPVVEMCAGSSRAGTPTGK